MLCNAFGQLSDFKKAESRCSLIGIYAPHVLYIRAPDSPDIRMLFNGTCRCRTNSILTGKMYTVAARWDNPLIEVVGSYTLSIASTSAFSSEP